MASLHFFDPSAPLRWRPSSQPLIGERTPFLLKADATPLRLVNDWLRLLPVSGVPAPSSWEAYARDLLGWVNFLELRAVRLVDAGKVEVAAYHDRRRISGPPDQRLSAGSWNRIVTVLTRLYQHLVDEGQIEQMPFTFRWARQPTREGWRPVRRNLATEKTHTRHATMRWLEPGYCQMFIDIGMAGLLPDGSDDTAFRGRERARNTAMALLAGGSGLRRQEFSHLLTWELPALPGDDSPFVAFPVPPGVAKGRKARTTWVSPAVLRRVQGYVNLERDIVVARSRSMPDRPLVVTEADRFGGRVNGSRLRWANLIPAERRRLVGPDGGSVLLFVTSTGEPMTDWDYVFAAASRRCQRFEAAFPMVSAHSLRHSFDVNTPRWLQQTQLASVLGAIAEAGGDPSWAQTLRAQDPLLILRDLLGHTSVQTTEVYLRLIDPTRLFTEADLSELPELEDDS